MNVKVYIDSLVYQKVMHWVNKSDQEVSGLGKVVSENGIFRVVDAVMIPQRNTGTTTDIEPEDAGKAMFLLKDAPGDLNWWWHSHVNMSVFWSGTDKETIEKIGAAGWCLATVFNKKREWRSALHVNDPYKADFMPKSLFIDEIQTQIFDPISAETIASWDTEYEKNVIKHEPKVYEYGTSQYGHWDKAAGKWMPAMTKKERKLAKRLARQAGSTMTPTGTAGTSKSDLIDHLIAKHEAQDYTYEQPRKHWPLDESDQIFILQRYGLDTSEWSKKDLADLASMIDEQGWESIDKLTGKEIDDDDGPIEQVLFSDLKNGGSV